MTTTPTPVLGAGPAAARWPDAVRDIVGGDLIAACALTTRFGGISLFPVCPFGMFDDGTAADSRSPVGTAADSRSPVGTAADSRSPVGTAADSRSPVGTAADSRSPVGTAADSRSPVGTVTMTSPAALCAKLPGLVERPQVALAFFSREHGLGSAPGFVLVQGEAEVQPVDSDALRTEAVARWPQFLGPIPTGRLQDRIQRAYVHDRVPITIRARRVCWWQDPRAVGEPDVVLGVARPAAPEPQAPLATPPRPPKPAKVGRQLARGPHRLLGWIDAEGFPTLVPVPDAAISSPDRSNAAGPGDTIVIGRGDLPTGGRRASLLAFWYRERLQGQGLLHARGWLDPERGGHLHPTTAEMFNLPASPLSPKLMVPLAVAAQHRTAERRGLVDGPRWLGDAGTRTGGAPPS